MCYFSNISSCPEIFNIFLPSKWQRMMADACLHPFQSSLTGITFTWVILGASLRQRVDIGPHLCIIVAVTMESKNISESSKSPTTTPFKPQPLFLHAISARTMLILYYIHRSHVLVWPLSPVSFLSGGRSNEGEIWCRHQTRDFGNSFLYELSRNATTPPLKCAWYIYG